MTVNLHVLVMVTLWRSGYQLIVYLDVAYLFLLLLQLSEYLPILHSFKVVTNILLNILFLLLIRFPIPCNIQVYYL